MTCIEVPAETRQAETPKNREYDVEKLDILCEFIVDQTSAKFKTKAEETVNIDFDPNLLASTEDELKQFLAFEEVEGQFFPTQQLPKSSSSAFESVFSCSKQLKQEDKVLSEALR